MRLAQTLALDSAPGWAWLKKLQSSGAALPRAVLVQRCINDGAIMAFMCDGAKVLDEQAPPGAARSAWARWRWAAACACRPRSPRTP